MTTNRKVWKVILIAVVAYAAGVIAVSMLVDAAVSIMLVHAEDIPAEQAPLTGILITQCNEVVAGYVTMPDGRLQRFDKSNAAQMSSPALQALIMSAKSKERIEIGCEGLGYQIFKPHTKET